ncbi:HNH endonuclease family protein [Streptomyces sp. NPDC053427]|uniref:HNH endonuclease family protein n=1 Tax=Streptomyces sp. NPDC053427 TaxID=3365701 RepID=UPI0037D91CE6
MLTLTGRSPDQTRGGARRGRRAGVGVLAGVLAVAVLSGCRGGPTADTKPPATDARGNHGVSPLKNPDGTKPGLAPLSAESEKAAARRLIAKVPTAGRGPKTGYARDRFGYAWMDTADGVPLARNGCDTRNDLLARDGRALRHRPGSDCIVESMTLDDPYTGRAIEWQKKKATEVQIDHVMPLSYDWQMGAARWTAGKRKQIANDPLNLLPSDGRANASKGDSGPASWLPPNRRIRCSYAVRFSQVALKYGLPVTSADKRIMLEQCAG